MGFAGAGQVVERRSEQRLAPNGAVRLRFAQASAVAAEGRLVDVSARGLRLRAKEAGDLGVETAVRVEIRLEPRDSPTGSRVQLTGRGRVVRRCDAPEGGTDLAVRFEAALAFLEHFPSFRVF
jgi:hypothetical protein